MKDKYCWSRAVEFYETDRAGVVHFSNYYRWMEAAEHAWWQDVGLAESLQSSEMDWPRVQAEMKFLGPLRFGDRVEVTLRMKKLGETSLNYHCEIRKNGRYELLGEGEMVVVCLQGGKKKGLPEAVRKAFAIS